MNSKDSYRQMRIREETLDTIDLLQRAWLKKDSTSIIVVIGSPSIHLRLMDKNISLKMINKDRKPPNCRKFFVLAKGVDADLIADMTGSILFILTKEVSEEVVGAIKSHCGGKVTLLVSRVEELADLVEGSNLKQDWILPNKNRSNADFIRRKLKYRRSNSRLSRLELVPLIESCLIGTECLFFKLSYPEPRD